MTFRSVQEDEHCYFVTATIVGWKKLFFQNIFAKIVLDSLQWHRVNTKLKLYAFVVMPNHVHVLVKPLPPVFVQDVLQGFGSFTAHEFLKQLRLQNEHELLEFFHQQALENRWEEQHQFWQQIQGKNVY
ncbi:MAG: transposase, partial [Ignavibacteriae bacterium]|nr:transposase [Ignavibacteriota bacterium]